MTNAGSPEFQKAAAEVKDLKSKPSDQELLDLYAYFKQVTEGDNTTTRPSAFDFKGKYKWDAWDKVKGTSTEDAEKKYIEIVEALKAKHS